MSVGTLQFMPEQLAHRAYSCSRPHGRALADLDLQFDDVFVAAQPEGGAFVGFEGGDQVEHDLRILDRPCRRRKAARRPGGCRRVGRAAAHDAGDQRAFIVGQAEGFGQFRRDFLGFDADPAARHRAVLDDLLHDAAGARDRNGEADAERAAGARVDGGVDADQIACTSTSAPPELPGVDRGVGLDEVLEGVDAEVRAAERRDDAHGHRLPDAERVADGEHDVADAKVSIWPKVMAGQFFGLDLQDGEIGFRVAADDFAFRCLPSLSETWMSSALQ
jgi:hypothetical protein